MTATRQQNVRKELIPIEGYILAFLETLRSQKQYSKSTILSYQNDLGRFMEYLHQAFDRLPALSDFNADLVAGFLDSERLAGYRRSTLTRRRAVLRGLETYLSNHGLISANFFSTEANIINKPIEQIQPKIGQQVLTPSEIERISKLMLASPRPRARRDHAIFSLLLETGLSVGKLIGLDVNDVKFIDRQWYLRLFRGPNPWLPISSSAPILHRYLTEGRPELNPTADEDALFISQTGKRVSRQGVWQVLCYWGRAVNLSITLSPRLVRNTAVARLVEGKRPISEIKALLGHTNHLSTLALVKRLELNHPKGVE